MRNIYVNESSDPISAGDFINISKQEYLVHIMSTTSRTITIKTCPICTETHTFNVSLDEVPLSVLRQSQQQSSVPRERELALICPKTNRTFKVTVRSKGAEP